MQTRASKFILKITDESGSSLGYVHGRNLRTNDSKLAMRFTTLNEAKSFAWTQGEHFCIYDAKTHEACLKF